MGQLGPPVVGLQFTESKVHAVFGGVSDAYEPSDFSFFDQDETATQWTGSFSSFEVVRRFGTTGDFVLSNSPFIFAPKEDFSITLQALDVKNGLVPCDGAGQVIEIRIGENVVVRLEKKDYAVEINPGKCIVTLFPTTKPHWIFGQMFLNRVYTALEFSKGDKPDRIGFANLKK